MRKKIMIISSIVFIVMATVGVVAVLAGDFTADDLVQVSGDSPFGALEGGCGNFPGSVPSAGTPFVDSEVEPYVDVNPTDADNIVGGWQQDRWSNGGSRGNVAGVSIDGGENWAIVPIPGITNCTGGEFQRASDPWVSFAPNGDVYFMSLIFDIDPPEGREGGFGPNGMAVNKSTDGGVTWSAPFILIRDDNPRFLNDKNSLTADPTDSNFVYAVWDRLQLPAGTVINPENVVGLGFKGPIYFSRTTDGGQNWDPARKIYDPGGNNQTIGNQIVVQPSDGTLVNFFNEILNFRNDDGGFQFDFNLALIRSTDKGKTWLPKGRPIRAAKMLPRTLFTPPPDFIGIYDPADINQPIRTGDVIPEVAVGPDDNLYAVWQDARFSNNGDFSDPNAIIDEVAFSMSSDGGFTWTAPIKINKTPTDKPLANRQAFIPMVRVGDDGTVAVTYYDFRNFDGSGDLETDYFVVHCHGNCSDPNNWAETQLTDVSFDMRQAPNARGFFVGDYEGLGTAGTDFFAFFSQSHDGDPSSVFFGRVGP